MSYVRERLKEELPADEIRRLADEWYRQQLAVLEKAHGPRWPEHRDWVIAYPQEELRQRLIAIGWAQKS